MKQKDISVIVFIIFISIIVSIFVSKLFITPPKNRQQRVEVVAPISGDFNTPNGTYFNDSSVDSTQLIRIGDSPNPQPFGGH